MTLSTFDFTSYKEFINQWIKTQSRGGHGHKSVIARESQCNPAYVTQVLTGDAQFSLEQAEKLKDLFGLSADEFDFFILLIEKERAGSATLKKYFVDKISGIQNARKQLKNRVKIEESLTAEVQMKYFSSWIYSAVHLATTIPTLTDSVKIAAQLKVDNKLVREVLQYLIDVNIIEDTKNGFKAGHTRLYLAHDSDFIVKHHMNWRVQAMKALDTKIETNLHYSSVVSISQADFQEIRELLMKAVQKTKDKVKDSKEETLVSFCLDFFKISVD